jgi:hypothetical protein
VTSAKDDGKARRVRTTFTPNQIQAMEKAFEITTYPDAHAREKLAQYTGLPEPKIQVIYRGLTL